MENKGESDHFLEILENYESLEILEIPLLPVPIEGNYPDPPTLALLKKARETPQKSKGCSLRGTPKILGKERKNALKKKGNRKKKNMENKKKQGLEGQGNLSTSNFQSEVGEVFGEIGTSGEVWKEILELLLLGKIVRSIFHQNSTANFTIERHYEVLGCGGPYLNQRKLKGNN